MAHFEWAKTDIECLNLVPLRSLQDAIGRIEHHYQNRGMVVCSFAVNGMKLSEEDESRLSNAPFDDVKCIGVWVEPVSNLLLMTIGNGQKFIDGLIDACMRIAEAFRIGVREDTYHALRKITDGLHMLHELSAQMITLQGFGQAELVQLQAELVGVAQDLIQGMLKKDVVALADSLEYDLPQTLINWRTRFDLIKRELGNRSTGVENS